MADYWNDEYQYELFAVDENGNIEDLGDLNNQENTIYQIWMYYIVMMKNKKKQ